MSEPERVVFDASRISTITERSDIDHHQSKKAILNELLETGEDWGDGFIVQDEPVVVTRSKVDGRIIRTVPMSEAGLYRQADENLEPVEGRTRPELSPIAISDREKIVDVLAFRLFKWYRDQPAHPTKYNPIHDGIPKAPPGSPENLQPIPGTKLFPATPGEVFEWLKTSVIGPRAALVNKKQNLTGFRSDIAQDYSVRISRKPL